MVSTTFSSLPIIISCAATLQIESFNAIFSLQRPHADTLSYSRIRPASSFSLYATSRTRLFASPDDDEEMNESMRAAFGKLDKLSSKDIDEMDDKRIEKSPFDSRIFEDRMKDLEEALKTDDEEGKRENMDAEELNLYTEMYDELSQGEAQIYGNLLGDLNSDGSDDDLESLLLSEDVKKIIGDQGSSRLFDDADGIGAIKTSPQTDDLLNRAVAEALKEAREITDLAKEGDAEVISPGLDSSSILEDKELMLQIDALFDRASKKLLASAEEMRIEQTVLARQSDENRQAKVTEEQVRLKEAAQSVTSLIVNVKKEATQVQNAIADLDRARSRASKDPLSQISNFRDLNIVKQSAFTGSLLFFIRAISEVPAALNGGSHGTAAIVQLGIAIVCAVLFILL